LYDPSGKVEAPPGVERIGWTPLLAARTWDSAVLGAEAMVGAARPGGDRGDAAHWSERSAALLACLLHAAAIDGASVDDVVSAVNRHEADRFATVLARNGADLACDLLTGILATDPREQSGIWSTTSSVLAGYRTEAALASARARPLDASALVSERATLYIASPSDHQKHVAALIAGLVRDVRTAAYEHHASAPARPVRDTRRDAASLDRLAPSPREGAPLLLVLDELAGIAPLHDLPVLIAEGASQGVLTLACLQDLSQARARWGGAADGFLTLFGTKVVLPGIGDVRTLEALSLLAGELEVPEISTTRGVGLFSHRSSSRTISTRRRPRLAPDAIANAPRGSALVYVGTAPERVTLAAPVVRDPWRSSAARSLRLGDARGLGRGR
jgi:type IV secretory pathway TraG/TraD family ATPase VirD4